MNRNRKISKNYEEAKKVFNKLKEKAKKEKKEGKENE